MPRIVLQHRGSDCDLSATVQRKNAGRWNRLPKLGCNAGGRYHFANSVTSPSGTATIDHLSTWSTIMFCNAVCLPTSVARVG